MVEARGGPARTGHGCLSVPGASAAQAGRKPVEHDAALPSEPPVAVVA
jgi:hypothetical protein